MAVPSRKVLRICETCGKKFYIYRSWDIQGHYRYCSKECRLKQVTITCSECGKSLKRSPRSLKSKNHFCSKKCQGRWNAKNRKGVAAAHWQGGKIKKVCKHCGKEFEVFKCKVDYGEGSFCSRQCAGFNKGKGPNNHNYKKLKVNCNYCGKELLAIPSRIKNNKHGVFCNKDCYYKWQSRNIRGTSSPSFNSKFLNCIICGKEYKLTPHLEKLGRTKYCSQGCYWKDLPNLNTGESHPLIKSRLNTAWYGSIVYSVPQIYCELWKDVNPRVHALFNYKCCFCGAPENGHSHIGHHVFYVKEACCWHSEDGIYYTNLNAPDHPEKDYCIGSNPNYFVILCRSCHGKTNGKFANRKKWADYFKKMIDEEYGGKCYLTKEEMDQFQRVNGT